MSGDFLPTDYVERLIAQWEERLSHVTAERDEWKATAMRDSIESGSEIDHLREIIVGLSRGDCFCEMGIGNPMVSSHSKSCVDATKWLKENE